MKFFEKFIALVTYIYDPIHYWWERENTQKFVASLLIFIFLFWLTVIEMNSHGILPEFLGQKIPKNPFDAVHLAFSLLLIFEVVTFIFVLPCSVTMAVAKQLEILSLIFLRNCFKLLIEFEEPINFSAHVDIIFQIGSYAFGALLLFISLTIYQKLKQPREGVESGHTIFYFVGAKKFISLLLILIFISLGIYNAFAAFFAKPHVNFFQKFYTILIFSDILIVLISHKFFPSYKDMFRNSGYAIATLLMRLCLTAPIYFDVMIGLMAAVFAMCLTYAYNRAERFF